MTQQRRPTARRKVPSLLAGAALALGLAAVVAPAANAVTLPGDADIQATPVPAVTLAVGETSIPHTIDFWNRGPATSTDWTWTMEVSPLVQPTIVQVDVEGTCEVNGQTITCSGAELPVDDNFYFSVQYTGVTPGTDINTVTVSGAENDPSPDNNTATGPVTVTGDDAALSGDWGTSGSDLLAPGDSRYYDLAFTCLSAGGCDYAPGVSITDQAINGASFGPGTNQLFINGTTPVGSCTVTTTDVDCQVSATGHAAQGDVLSASDVRYNAEAGTAPDTLLFTQTLGLPTGWVGNDASNDTYPISTPPEVGSPIVPWQGAAALAGLVLIGGTGVMLRRRHVEGQDAA